MLLNLILLVFLIPTLRETSQCDVCRGPIYRVLLLITRSAGIIEDFAAGNHRRGAQQACNSICQCRFATPTFTRQAKNLTALQAKTHIDYTMYRPVRPHSIAIEIFALQQRTFTHYA